MEYQLKYFYNEYKKVPLFKLRNNLLNGKIFGTILEARVIAEKWQEHYNKVRAHSLLNFAPPVLEVIVPHQIASS
jgi:hypothetical protein